MNFTSRVRPFPLTAGRERAAKLQFRKRSTVRIKEEAMNLKIGKTYRVYIPAGDGNSFLIVRLTVESDEGGGWYQVTSGPERFFLNLNQVVKVYED